MFMFQKFMLICMICLSSMFWDCSAWTSTYRCHSSQFVVSKQQATTPRRWGSSLTIASRRSPTTVPIFSSSSLLLLLSTPDSSDGQTSAKQAPSRRGATTKRQATQNDTPTSNQKRSPSTPRGQNKQNNQQNGQKRRYNNKISKNNNSNNNNNNSNRRRQQNGSGRLPTQRNHSPSGESRRMNRQIVDCASAQEVLRLLASTKGVLSSVAGGGVLNSVNFSTAIHRIARHLQHTNNNNNNNNNNNRRNNNNNYNNYGSDDRLDDTFDENDRSKILADPRFALLMCSTAEALLGGSSDGNKNTKNEVLLDTEGQPIVFGFRELANMGWAIAKMKIVPPQDSLPVEVAIDSESLLRENCEEVRSLVFEVAMSRQRRDGTRSTASWIPALSMMCGRLMDVISYRVVNVHSSMFRLQELSNLLWALATSQRATEEIFGHLISALTKGMRELQDNTDDAKRTPLPRGKNKDDNGLWPQEWANAVWALGTSGIVGPEDDLLPFLADLMNDHPEFLDMFKPQELSNTIWGTATIMSKRAGLVEGPTGDAALEIFRHVVKQLIERRGQRYKSQELTNTVWSMATLGIGLSPQVWAENPNDYTVLNSKDVEGDRRLTKEAIDILLQESQRNIRRFRSQEINNIAWTLARLDYANPELIEVIANELSNPRRKVEPQDIATTLWSLATLEYNNEEVYRKLAQRVTRAAGSSFKPQELSSMLWAFAKVEIMPTNLDAFDTTLLRNEYRPSSSEISSDPVAACFGIAGEELMKRPQQFKPQEIKDVLWAFSKVGVRHPNMFRAAAEHMVGSGDDANDYGRDLQGFSTSGLNIIAWAFARQAQLGAEATTRVRGKTKIYLSTGRLGAYTSSFIDVGESLIRKLMTRIAEMDLHAYDNLSRLKSQDISNTVWAFSILGMKHTEFLNAVIREVKNRMSRYVERCNGKSTPVPPFKGQEIANILWGLATLNCRSYEYDGQGSLLSYVEKYLVATIRNNGGEGGGGRQRQHDDDDTSTVDDDMSVESVARAFNRQELANIAWACAVFGEYPPQLIRLIYLGLLGYDMEGRGGILDGDHDDEDPATIMTRIHGDEGLQRSTMMSLVYLQIVMDLENRGMDNKDHGFFLPEGFPEQWDAQTGSGSGYVKVASRDSNTNGGSGGWDEDDDGMLELHLIRSRIQTSVSEAFHRINFSHVEEHVISMSELADDFDVHIDRNGGRDILSLDLADVATRTAIEVDGPAHFISRLDGDDRLKDDFGYLAGQVKETKNGNLDYCFMWGWERQEMNGPTLLKLRILRGLGWDIHNVPFWEWRVLNGDADAEDEYCRKVLERGGHRR